MALSKFDGLQLPASADFHVHLRDGNMMKAVVPTVRQGGVNTVYVSAILYCFLSVGEHKELEIVWISLSARVLDGQKRRIEFQCP